MMDCFLTGYFVGAVVAWVALPPALWIMRKLFHRRCEVHWFDCDRGGENGNL